MNMYFYNKQFKLKAKTAKNNNKEVNALLAILQSRFEKNMDRHKGIKWDDVAKKLQSNTGILNTLQQMEQSGGEPDVVRLDKKTGQYSFMDCAAESPTGRRSLCYDKEALDKRKENKPKGNAMQWCAEIGATLLTEEEYHYLQTLGQFDLKTSSWLLTPAAIRKLGGAIFGDRRFDRVFIYHNGAESYYAARGFRCLVLI
jgi:hypothetical protein